MPLLTPRAKNLVELKESAHFLLRPPTALTAKAAKILDAEARALLLRLGPGLEALQAWREADLEAAVRTFAEAEGLGLGRVAQPLRAALTGSHASPGIFEVMALLGREECLCRIFAPPTGQAAGEN